MAQKMALVPHEYLLPLPKRYKVESHLESDIESLLNTNDIPDDVKAKLLSNLLSKYKKIVHTPVDPVKVAVVPDSKEQEAQPSKVSIEEEEDADPIVKQILLSIPLSTRKFVPLLIDKMREGDMSWSKLGVVEINGKPLPGSNIIDFFSYIMRNRKFVDIPPSFPLFFHHLTKQNIPIEWIQNNTLKQNEMEARAKRSPLRDPFLESYFTPVKTHGKAKTPKSRKKLRSHSPGKKWLEY